MVWSIAKSQYGNKLCSSIPDLLENDIRISDYKLKAQLLNDYFANQSTLINADVAPVPSLPTSSFSLSSIVVNESEVLCILYHLNVSKACGFDNISNKIQTTDSLYKPFIIHW